MKTSPYPRHRLVLPVVLLAALSGSHRVLSQDLDFSHDVVPILQAHCVECHGGKEAKGSFSINTRDLIVDSGFVELDSPEDSYLLELVESDDPDAQMPPKERDRLKPAEIATLKRWIAQQVPWEAGFSFAPDTYEPPFRPRRPELPPAQAGRQNPIDRILDADLKQRGEAIPGPIDDAEFLRRATLDLVGLLPTPEVLETFLADPRTDKRERYLQTLFEDRVRYAEHWLTFFNDLLRNDYSGTGFITGGRKQISQWLYQSLIDNKPFDQMVRELVAPPTDASRGYIDGIRWRGTVSAGQTVEIQFAQSVAQSFLGINLKCASCHDSFIDRWTLEEAFGLAAVYSEQPLELHRCDKPLGRTATAAWLFPEIGQIDPQKPPAERLSQLADLMTHRENGRFARTIVNRLWYQLMGRGIVHPIDAMQTEPFNADLLDYLATYLVDQEYDLQQVQLLIASSQAYQSQIAADSDGGQSASEYHGPLARRLTAEQFLDAVWQLTGAAPTTVEAPVVRPPPATAASESDAAQAPPTLSSDWIWNRDDHQAPPQTLVFRKQVAIEQPVVGGSAVITCDNTFTLYINGRKIETGSLWTEVKSFSSADAFQQGDNTIVVVATNTTDAPSPAGLFFEAHLLAEDGSRTKIVADESWQWSDNVPANQDEKNAAEGPGPWQSAKKVPPLGAWRAAVNPQALDLLSGRLDGKMRMVRASLLKNTALMRSLGRPGREQIVSMRPDELSTLEAINLANEASLAAAFSSGAEQILSQQGPHSDKIVRYVYRFALSREPTDGELAALTEYLGSSPSEAALQDVLWAVCMLPEFLLVR